MCQTKLKFWIFAAFLVAIGFHSWTLAVENDRWCFQFTWLGPSADNITIEKNYSCSDLLSSTESQPCFNPFVITDDGTPPDTSLMWKQFSAAGDIETIAKPFSFSEVCIKWSVYFDGSLVNITYFKGKMMDDDGDAIYNDCESQTMGAYTIEACACRDYLGIPCNDATRRSTDSTYVVLLLLTAALWISVFRMRIA
ncbi:uncharacterized protein [Anabrus simplex]|uniref:uncharacterized protein n=1 Tax=Anabrus simplex TaxID=316456 RepID=UPI0035A2E78D